MRKLLLISTVFLFTTIIALTLFLAWERQVNKKQYRNYHSVDVIHAMYKPSPALSAKKVVEIQLKALQHNDRFNNGIRHAFYFTTIYNEEGKKKYHDFQRMFRSGTYTSILNHRYVVRSPISYYKNNAFQIVTVLDQKNRKTEFLFELTLQKESPAKGCWLTKNVRILREESPFSVI